MVLNKNHRNLNSVALSKLCMNVSKGTVVAFKKLCFSNTCCPAALESKMLHKNLSSKLVCNTLHSLWFDLSAAG